MMTSPKSTRNSSAGGSSGEREAIPASRPSERYLGNSVLVAMVALDTATEAMVVSAIGDDREIGIESFSSLNIARAALEKGPPRATVLITESAELRILRAFPSNVYVVAFAGPDRSTSREGVDDFLHRPISPDELRSRLRRAAKRLANEHRASTYSVLRAAMYEGKTGELTVSHGDQFAKILLDAGKLAWIHRSSRPVSIRALLAACGVTIEDDVVREVVEESRRSKRYFGEILVEWGLVDPEPFRESLRSQLRKDLEAILEWKDASATFVQARHQLNSSLTFEEEEVPLTTPTPNRIETVPGFPAVRLREPIDDEAVGSWIVRVSAIENTVGCALLDAQQGTVLGSFGLEPDEMTVAWGLAGGFAGLGPEGDELWASTKQRFFFLRWAPRIPAVAVICFDPRKTSQAMARILVAKAFP